MLYQNTTVILIVVIQEFFECVCRPYNTKFVLIKTVLIN